MANTITHSLIADWLTDWLVVALGIGSVKTDSKLKDSGLHFFFFLLSLPQQTAIIRYSPPTVSIVVPLSLNSVWFGFAWSGAGLGRTARDRNRPTENGYQWLVLPSIISCSSSSLAFISPPSTWPDKLIDQQMEGKELRGFPSVAWICLMRVLKKELERDFVCSFF